MCKTTKNKMKINKFLIIIPVIIWTSKVYGTSIEKMENDSIAIQKIEWEQKNDLKAETDTITGNITDTTQVIECNYAARIKNTEHLDSFFYKLHLLEERKRNKINVVHIGDSHIQADFLTNAIRQPLQEKFGNGGYGFTFPYSLAKGSSGTGFFRFISNTIWQSCRNNQPFKCHQDAEIGLCGYGFTSMAKQFVISLEVNDPVYYFNTIKVITPYDSSCFRLASAQGYPVIQSVQSSVKLHKIKSGESLSVIAAKYNVSIAAIKKENNMKSNTIYAGKTLRIPIKTQQTQVDLSLFQPIEWQKDEQFCATYHQEVPASRIFLFPNGNPNIFNLNGLVLLNDNPGLIYHSIGTVGSKVSDFNATPLFFQQLPILTPDLIVLSFGTNDSYGKISAENFIQEIQTLLNNIEAVCPDVPVLVMTPPTSLLPRKALNTYVSDYSRYLMQQQDYALWDLYTFTGGMMGPRKPSSIFISSDNVHYTAQGYTNQGNAFADDLLYEYEHYKQKNDSINGGKTEIVPLDLLGKEIKENTNAPDNK